MYTNLNPFLCIVLPLLLRVCDRMEPEIVSPVKTVLLIFLYNMIDKPFYFSHNS
jgi:hypothetical protein